MPSHSARRSRAADIVGTCVQNNPKVQSWFLQVGIVPQLLRLLSDADAEVLAKALFALGSLVRNNSECLSAARAAGAHAAVAGLAQHADIRVRWASPGSLLRWEIA